MNTSTPSVSDTSTTEEQVTKFRRLNEDTVTKALKIVNPDKEGLQQLLTRGGEYQAYMIEGIRRFTAKAPDYSVARKILSKDFISPEDIAKARPGVVYTDEQLASFGSSIPSEKVLEWCRDHNCMLVAGPSRPLSLLEIRDLKPNLFYSESEGWYAEDRQVFSRNDKAGTRWIMLRKEPIPGSTSKTWDEQQKLLSKEEIVPNVAEAVWGITTYKAVRNVYLFPNVYVRTSSVDADGNRVIVGGRRVYVGNFDGDRLHVSHYWDGHRNDNLGLASARSEK